MEIRNLDELPRYSPWPARILGAEPWTDRVKTPDEIDREFGREKWGALLQRFRATPAAGLNDVDQWAAGTSAPSLATVAEHLVLMTPGESHNAYISYIGNALGPYLPATDVVELGCGYGSVILGLSRHEEFRGANLYAADYTLTGPELAAAIAGREGVSLTSGQCDLKKNPVTTMPVPEGALIYTAYAAQYVEPITRESIEGIAALKPKAVVHVEPLYEHCDPDTLLGLLRRRYIEMNGYNRNLLTMLRQLESEGSVRIIQESVAAFGPNPLLAASVIAWAPSES